MTPMTPMTNPILNLADAVLVPRPPDYMPSGETAQRIEMRLARIGPALGLRLLGCSLVAVAPGKQAFPFHSHWHNDELFVVLTGHGELRFGSICRPLREGDVVGCPAGGPDTAHAITNTGHSELRYLALSSQRTPEVCAYPDSGKTGWFDDRAAAPGDAAAGDFVITRGGQVVDDWDGE